MSVMARDGRANGRFYSGGAIPEGERYPSVTTILTAIGKPALVAWSAKVEREMVIAKAAELYMMNASAKKKWDTATFSLKLTELLGKEKAHTKELAKAGEIGSNIHELIEWSLRAELLEKVGPSPILGEQAQWGYSAFQKWRSRTKLKPVMVERFVWCHCHKIAGTMDLLAELDGAVTVCDWKTGKRVYFEAKLQNAAYRHCIREMGLANPEKGFILRLPKTVGDPDFEPVDAGKEDYYFERFLHVKDLWELMQREEGVEPL